MIIASRKYIFAFFLVILNDYPGLNIIVFMVMNVCMIYVLVVKRPFVSKVFMVRDVVCEIGFLVIHSVFIIIITRFTTLPFNSFS